MKSTTYCILLLLMAYCSSAISQQTVTFGYDIAGNRVLRQFAVKELKAGDSTFLLPAQTEPLDSELMEDGEAAFIVYPNPSPTDITIENTGKAIEASLSYLVYDSQGKVQMEGSSRTNKTILNLQQLQSGVYLLQIEYSGKWQVFRLIKP